MTDRLIAEHGLKNLPQKIRVTIGRSPRPVRTIGFGSEPTQPHVSDQVWEYDFLEKKANSIRYQVRVEGQPYSLYVPGGVFKGRSYPDRLYVYIGMPGEKQAPSD